MKRSIKIFFLTKIGIMIVILQYSVIALVLYNVDEIQDYKSIHEDHASIYKISRKLMYPFFLIILSSKICMNMKTYIYHI